MRNMGYENQGILQQNFGISFLISSLSDEFESGKGCFFDTSFCLFVVNIQTCQTKLFGTSSLSFRSPTNILRSRFFFFFFFFFFLNNSI